MMSTQTDLPSPAAPTDSAHRGPRQALAAIVGELCEVSPAEIGADFVLGSAGPLRSSIGRARLDAKIRRRLGVHIENLHTLRTFGELENSFVGKELGTTLPPPQSGPFSPAESQRTALPTNAPSLVGIRSAEADLRCGIDIESISAMPEAKDYWEEPFYMATFTAAEIAYCVSQTNPRMHFAARWCAKEAFKKCLPRYGQREMNRIEVVRASDGQPFLRVVADEGAQSLPVALSLTHCEDWALAIVVCMPERPLPVPRDPDIPTKGGRLAIAFSLMALAFALFALGLALHYK
jgi:holo-[acyl-carrier protein] synthase